MYRRFGSRVTVVEMAPRIVAREDDDVSTAIQAMLEGEGIAFRLNAQCLRDRKSATAGIGIHVSSAMQAPRDIIGSHAAARRSGRDAQFSTIWGWSSPV